MLALALQLLLPGSIQRLPVDPLVRNGVTPYHVLQKNFDRGQGAALREMRGSYPGRCYFFDSPTKPIASVLVVSNGDTKMMGPAFAADDYKKITPLIEKNAAPNRFDKLDHEAVRAIDIAVKRESDANAYPVSSNNSLVIEGMRTVDYQLRNYAIRKAKRFFVLRMTCEEDNYCLNHREGTLNNRVIAESGDSNVVCYYWPPGAI